MEMMPNGMDRAEWIKSRHVGIGGSEAAAVLGLSPWATPVTVWMDKTGRAGPKPETEAMRLGTELEDFVARRYTQETGKKVQRFNTMLHDGCLLGNFDRLVIPDGGKVASYHGEVRTDLLLECKTSSRQWDDTVPIYYQTQVQHYMGLSPALQHADVACLFLAPFKEFKVYRVERDDAVIAYMRERLTAWWNEFVLGDKIPTPTSEDDCKLLWARSNPGKRVFATESTIAQIEALKEAEARMGAAEAEVEAARSKILAEMGDAEILAGADGKPLATWKSTKDSAKTDWKAVAEAIGATPDIISANTTVRPGFRRFLVK